MPLNKKLKAMTIQELLVVIIISTIVIGMAFSVLRIVQKHMWSIESHLNTNNALVRLEQSLWIDFNRYNSVSYNALENRLDFKSEIDSISYRFLENAVVKSRDTFPVKVSKPFIYFNGEQIHSGKIDAIKLPLETKGKNKNLFVYKRKDANQFMN